MGLKPGYSFHIGIDHAPRHSFRLHGPLDRLFPRREGRLSRFDLDEHNLDFLRSIEPIEGNQVDGRTQKSNVLGIEIKSRQIWHDVLRHLALGNGHASLYGIDSDRLFVCLLPLLEPQACVGIGKAPEFSFERLFLFSRRRSMPACTRPDIVIA